MAKQVFLSEAETIQLVTMKKAEVIAIWMVRESGDSLFYR